MKQFYETYYKFPKLSSLLREISWSSNLHIISKTKSIEEREFYLRLAVKERYSVRELERQIDSGCFERTILSKSKNDIYQYQISIKEDIKLSTPSREIQGYFKDTYVLEFLDLPEKFNEKTLQKSLVNNLKHFLIELGRDFCFIGEEFRIQVGNNDFYIDLLLFHRELQCLVAIELKTDDFKPEYLGKLNFYLEVLDNEIKKSHENPSVGIILCKNRNVQVVEYSLNRNMSPALIAEYETKLIDKSILEKRLRELFDWKD